MSNNPIDIIHEFVSWAHAKRTEFNQLVNLSIEQFLRTDDPQWDNDVPADVSTMPYVVNYKNRRHIYIYNPGTVLTLTDTAGEWKQTLNPQSWTNVSIPNGTRLTATTGPAVIKVKCTDEVVP